MWPAVVQAVIVVAINMLVTVEAKGANVTETRKDQPPKPKPPPKNNP